jgi:hypothetical protein
MHFHMYGANNVYCIMHLTLRSVLSAGMLKRQVSDDGWAHAMPYHAMPCIVEVRIYIYIVDAHMWIHLI